MIKNVNVPQNFSYNSFYYGAISQQRLVSKILYFLTRCQGVNYILNSPQFIFSLKIYISTQDKDFTLKHFFLPDCWKIENWSDFFFHYFISLSVLAAACISCCLFYFFAFFVCKQITWVFVNFHHKNNKGQQQMCN